MPDLDQAAKRPAQYLAETGVLQVTSGLVVFLLGLGELAQYFWAPTPAAQDAIRFLSILCVGAVYLAVYLLKERVVFPRTGRVVLFSRRVYVLASLVCIVITMLVVIGFHVTGNRSVLIIGPTGKNRLAWAEAAAVIVGLTLMLGGILKKMRLATVLGFFNLCLVASVLWFSLDSLEGAGLLGVGLGGSIAGFGLVRLRDFLRANPSQEEPAHG